METTAIYHVRSKPRARTITKIKLVFAGAAVARTYSWNDEVAVMAPNRSLGYHLWHGFLNTIIVLVTMAIFAWFGPGWWYELGQGWEKLTAARPTFAGQKTQFSQWFNALTVTPIAGQSAVVTATPSATPTVTPKKTVYQPPVDPTLPDGQWLVIPRIGVRSELQPTANYETALETGLWLAPDFGMPGSQDMPMIVAGHRYGWKWWWQDDYWKYHSFYLLPQLQKGDRVEVIADHRKWVYEVYAEEEGTEITDYNADIILYTCKYLNSPVRFFRYAKLVDPTAPTQQ
jgi:sortase (surface protein transpeptidase)